MTLEPGGSCSTDIGWSEFRSREDDEEMKLGIASVGESVQEAGGNVHAVAGLDRQELVAEMDDCLPSDEMQDLLARVGVIEHVFAGQ